MTDLKDIEQAGYTAPVKIPDAAVQAALLSMANDNIGSDVQGLLTHGFAKLNAKPNALRNAIAAAIPHLSVLNSDTDVPDLVRYVLEHDYDDGTSLWADDGNLKAEEGEYVRYDQAIAIIDAKDAELKSHALSNMITKPIDVAAVPSHVIEALQSSLAFVEGFDGDELQEGIPALIGKLRTALSAEPAQGEQSSPIYRMLRPNDLIEKNDEFLGDDAVTWERLGENWSLGLPYHFGLKPARRPLPAAPTTEAGR